MSYRCMGWDGMVIVGHRSSKSTFEANNIIKDWYNRRFMITPLFGYKIIPMLGCEWSKIIPTFNEKDTWREKMCPLTFEVQICSFCTQSLPSTNWTIIRSIWLRRLHFPVFCSTWSNLLVPSKLLLSPSKQIVQQNALEIIAHQNYLNCEYTTFALETLAQSNL